MTVLVVGGDPVVGRTLASLLKSAHRDVRYVDLSYLEQPGALDGVGVLLLAPPWSSNRRTAVREMIEAATSASHVPVLEIGLPDDDAGVDTENYVPWPCRTEELQRRIDAVRCPETTVD